MADSRTRRTLARAAARLNAEGPHAGKLPPLILMTDDWRLPDPCAAAQALPRGSIVIVRARDRARRAELATAMIAVSRKRDLLVLVASDPDLAARIGADGIHLPEARAREALHWRARYPRWFITAAAHDLRALALARHADAVLLSPVFATRSHEGAAFLGPLRLRLLAMLAPKPVYALGGIDANSVGRLQAAPVAGIAAIGALSV